MFFIVNKTKQTLVLGDLGVTLGPRQAVDLDKMVPRSKSDSSKYLRMANKSGQIEIRSKDGEKPKHPDKQPQVQSISLDGLHKEFKEMKEMMGQQTRGIGKSDLADFAKEIIKSIPKSTETVIYRQDGEKRESRTDEEVEINEDELVEINARAVDHILEGTNIKSMRYKEETKKDDLMNNIEELENLLG